MDSAGAHKATILSWRKNMKFITTKLASITGALGLTTLIATFLGPIAMAADTGLYAGFNFGQTRANIDDDRINENLLNQGFSSVTIEDDDRDRGFKIFGGYQLHRNFAIEGGYFDLGKFGYSAMTVPPGTLDGEIKVRGINLDLVGILPITEQFSAFARAGVNHHKSKDTFAGTGLVNVLDPSPRERDTNYKFGFGIQYDFTEALGLRAEAERYRINDAVENNGDIDLYSVGLVYRFGGKTERVADEPVAKPKPALVIVPVPVAMKTEQYCSILDMQFEINVDNIQRDDEEKLGVVGKFMNKYVETTAVVEGHTDNVGTPEANLTLSQRRAESVVAYLMKSFNISSSRLKAVGYGETRPIADNSTETGKRQNRRINTVIACASDIEGLTVVPARVTMAMEMEFAKDSFDVSQQYRAELAKVASFMKANPTVKATVEGHTSNQTGGPAQQMQLSRQRAESVVNVLVNEFDLSRTRFSTEGFGDTRRTAYNTTLEGQQENRRINIIFDFPGK